MIFFDQFPDKNVLLIVSSELFLMELYSIEIFSMELFLFIFEIRQNYIIIFFKSCGENKFV